MSESKTPPQPDAQTDADPNRDRDKPKYPAPGGAGEGGTSRNPVGASGPPATGVEGVPEAGHGAGEPAKK
jgi:hypothetical protein